jgi:hypothetical protein
MMRVLFCLLRPAVDRLTTVRVTLSEHAVRYAMAQQVAMTLRHTE